MRQAHYDEWKPEGVTEECLVDDLCGLRWKKRRMLQYDQVRLKQRSDKIHRTNDVREHRRILRNWSIEFSSAASIEGAEKILSLMSPFYNEIITEWVPREKCTDPTQWGCEIGKFLSKLEVEVPLEDPDLFAAIVDPELMEKEIARSDRLDEAIDRTIKRLMQVKAAKQIFPNMRKNVRQEPKLINAPATADRQLPALIENEPKCETQTEIVVPAKSDLKKGTFTAQTGVVIEGTGGDPGEPATVPPDPTEKEHFWRPARRS